MAARSAPVTARFNGTGEIDYRLTRQALISQYRGGRLARHEVCDAHPELRRNATELGMATDRPCPICERRDLVLVTYVFGTRLPASGRCLSAKGELAKIALATRHLHRVRGRGVHRLLVEPPDAFVPGRLTLNHRFGYKGMTSRSP